MQNKLSSDELFKDWTPEVLEYDPDIDGDEHEHLIRDKHLEKKDEVVNDVLAKIKKKQAPTRGTRG
jgi:hypothetical protein